jgi:hypothetical protein
VPSGEVLAGMGAALTGAGTLVAAYAAVLRAKSNAKDDCDERIREIHLHGRRSAEEEE